MINREARLKERRGATMVLVAVMIMVLAGMAAFAIDLARVYTGINEMQTGADATALRAGLAFQRTGASPVDSAVAFASQNSAFGSPLSIAANDVQPIQWSPRTNSYLLSPSWPLANGVRVTVRRETRLPFGGLLGRRTISPVRSSVVWVASQTARDCMEPWGFSEDYLSTLLAGRSLYGQGGIGFMSQQIRTLNGPQDLTVVARPSGTERGPRVAPTTFDALSGLSASIDNYSRELAGLSCNDGVTAHIARRLESASLGAGGDDVARRTIRGVQDSVASRGSLCSFGASNPDDATCFDPMPPHQIGVDVVVAVVSSPGGGSDRIIRAIMGFKLMCVFRGDTLGPTLAARSGEYCPFLSSNPRFLHDSTYTPGTIVGYPIPRVALIGGKDSVGTELSTVQKLLLVR